MNVVRVLFRARPPEHFSKSKVKEWYRTFKGFVPYDWKERPWIYPQIHGSATLKLSDCRIGVGHTRIVKKFYYEYVEADDASVGDSVNPVQQLLDRWSRGMVDR